MGKNLNKLLASSGLFGKGRHTIRAFWRNRNDFLRQVVLLASSSFVAQAIVIATSPVLTRLYTPSDYGVLAVYVSLLTMIGASAGLRYNLAIPLGDDEAVALNTLTLAMSLTLIVSLLLGATVWLFGDWIAMAVNSTEIRAFLWLLPIGVFLVGSYNALSAWALRRQAFSPLARTKLTQAITSVGVQIASGLLDAGPIGLISGQVLGQSMGLTRLSRTTLTLRLFKYVSVTSVLQAARRYWKFPAINAPGALLNNAALQLPQLIVAVTFGIEIAGMLMLARRILATPLEIVSKSVGQVYFSQAARFAVQDVSSFRRLFLQTSARMLIFTTIPLVAIAFGGPRLFALLLGEHWYGAGEIARLLTPMLIGQITMAPVAQTFIILERQGYSFGLNVIKVAITLVAFLGAGVYSIPAHTAIGVYSALMFLYYAVVFTLSLNLLNRYASVEPVHGRH